MTRNVDREDKAESRDSRVVEDHPDAVEENDRKTLGVEEAFEDQYPGATTDVREMQALKKAQNRDPDAGEKKIGSALPREQGRRS